MKTCELKSDPKKQLWYEDEYPKIAKEILNLGLAKPALRALIDANIYTVKALNSLSLSQIQSMHGMGKSAIKKIQLLQ